MLVKELGNVSIIVSYVTQNIVCVISGDGLHILPPIARRIGRAWTVAAAALKTAASLTEVSSARGPREEFESFH